MNTLNGVHFMFHFYIYDFYGAWSDNIYCDM